MKFKLGCDPEFFLKDGDKFVSAAGLFPGTKSEPFPLEKGAVQVDGTALEINVDPAETSDEFDGNITKVLDQVTDMVKNVSKDLAISFTPFVVYDKEYFDLLPFDCKLLGCDPDFDLRGKQKAPDPELQFEPFRAAGGHVHIGFRDTKDPMEKEHFDLCLKIAKAFVNEDIFNPRSALERRRAVTFTPQGSFRPKKYGVELRSPSNVWVENSASRVRMFNTVQKVIGVM